MDFELFEDFDLFGAVDGLHEELVFRDARGGGVGFQGGEVQDDLAFRFGAHGLDRDLDALLGEGYGLRLGELLNGDVEHHVVAGNVDQGVGVDLLNFETVGDDLTASLPSCTKTDLFFGKLDSSQRLARVDDHPDQSNRHAGLLGSFVELAGEYLPAHVELDPAANVFRDGCASSEVVCEGLVKTSRNDSLGLHDVHRNTHPPVGDLRGAGHNVEAEPGQQRHRGLVPAGRQRGDFEGRRRRIGLAAGVVVAELGPRSVPGVENTNAVVVGSAGVRSGFRLGALASAKREQRERKQPATHDGFPHPELLNPSRKSCSNRPSSTRRATRNRGPRRAPCRACRRRSRDHTHTRARRRHDER